MNQPGYKIDLSLLFSVLLILFGAFLFIYGGYDDSPGAQGLGLGLALFGIVKIRKAKG